MQRVKGTNSRYIPIAGILGSILGNSERRKFLNQRFSVQILWHRTCLCNVLKNCHYAAEDHRRHGFGYIFCSVRSRCPHFEAAQEHVGELTAC